MKYDGPLATVQDLTALGVRQAEAWCQKCDHRAMIPLDKFAPWTVFVAIRHRLTCTACGNRDIDLSPDWRDHRPAGRI